MPVLTRRATLGLLAASPFLARPAFAATPPVYAEDGVAIDGSDTVAYFAGDGPVAGDPAITHDWNGAVWQFASAANRDRFAANPEQYAPAFGGWCAYAVSKGYTAATVPHAWTLLDGGLYLNFSRSVQFLWRRDIPGNIAKGNANWPGVLA